MITFITNATVRTTNVDNGDFNDHPWSPSGSLQDGDTLIIDNPITINGNINYSSINVVFIINDTLTFGNPSFLQLGCESVLIFNAKPIVINVNNNDDKIKICSNVFLSNEIASIEIGQELTKNGIAIPVELLSLDIKLINKQPVIRWSTASEQNNDFYSIKKSEDGSNYYDVARIGGNGTTTDVNHYEYVDETTSTSDKIYYELSQTDFDGTHEVLGVVGIRLETKNICNFNIPVDEIVINIQYYDFNGNLYSSLDDDIPNKYILVLRTNKNTYVKKFMKQ